jgi:hypothetical protein
MADSKRNIVDDITDGVRQILDELDRLLNPGKGRKPVPVPIPVHVRPQRRNPQDPYQ